MNIQRRSEISQSEDPVYNQQTSTSMIYFTNIPNQFNSGVNDSQDALGRQNQQANEEEKGEVEKIIEEIAELRKIAVNPGNNSSTMMNFKEEGSRSLDITDQKPIQTSEDFKLPKNEEECESDIPINTSEIPAVSDPKSAIVETINRGYALAEQGKCVEAEEQYKGPIKVDPESASVYINWGHALDEQGKYIEAAEKFERAATIDPNLADAYSMWGAMLSKQGKYQEAAEKYERAISINPNDPQAYLSWGNTLAKQGDDQAAIEIYKTATTIDPKYAHAYVIWGRILEKQGKYQEAEEKYEQTIKIHPTCTEAYLYWALTLQRQRKYQKALKVIERGVIGPASPIFESLEEETALELQETPNVSEEKDADHSDNILTIDERDSLRQWCDNSNSIKECTASESSHETTLEYFNVLSYKDSILYCAWGDSLLIQRKYENAVKKYEKAITVDPKCTHAYVMWGNALAQQKKYKEAAEKYEIAISIDPKSAHAYFDWGDIPFLQKNDQEAAWRYEAYFFWGDALVKEGKHLEAVEKYQRAVTINPNYSNAHFRLGNIFAELGKYKEAAEKYERATSNDCDNADAYLYWGTILAEQKNYKEAAEKYKRVLLIDPENSYAYCNWGTLLYEQFKYVEAANILSKGLSINESNVFLYINYGVVQYQQGNTEEMNEIYFRAIRNMASDPDSITGVVISTESEIEKAKQKLPVLETFTKKEKNHWKNHLEAMEKFRTILFY